MNMDGIKTEAPVEGRGGKKKERKKETGRDLLGEVGGVDDEFGLEEGVLAVLGEEAQIQGQVEVGHGFVQESRMPRLVP